MKRHPLLILGLLIASLLGSFVHAQAAGTRVTPCAAATPNNALCISWTHDGKTVDGQPLTGVTFRVEQKFGSGAYATVATGISTTQFYAQNLAPGTYTFRVFANCPGADCIESPASNEASKGASANPVQPSAPVIIVAATIREGLPPVYRIVQSVTLKPNEVILVAPASMRPLFAAR